MRYIIDEATLTNIADAIRTKTDTEERVVVAEMANTIKNIRTTAIPILEGITITPTGKEIVEVPAPDKDGFGVVTVEGDDNLSPENVKSGVTIYGVEGILDSEGGIDTSDATATEADILDGASAYVNGKKIVGTHVCQADPILQMKYITPTGEEFSVTPDEGVDGFDEVIIEGDANLVPENILAGSAIYGVEGAVKFASLDVKPQPQDQRFEPEDSGYSAFNSVYVEGDQNLVADNILSGVTIFGVEGTAMTEADFNEKKLTTKEVTPGTQDIVLKPEGDYSGFSQVTVLGDAGLIPGNIIQGATIFGVNGSALSSSDDDSNLRACVLPMFPMFYEEKKDEDQYKDYVLSVDEIKDIGKYRSEGWSAKDIALALGIPESVISKFLG